jgi:chromosomal replication initiator protein
MLNDGRHQMAHRLLRDASDATGVSVEAMVGSCRAQCVHRVRALVAFMARDVCDLTLVELGRVFGGRHHTTMMTACRRAERLVQTDPSAKALLARIVRHAWLSTVETGQVH